MSYVSTEIKTSNYTITINNASQYYLIDATSGNITLDLPDVSSSDGMILEFQRKDASVNTVTLVPYSGQTFMDSTSSKSINTQFQYFYIISMESGKWYYMSI